MKLPPVALTAPTLCPRCDAPALTAGPALSAEQCLQCELQLRQCGKCRGVAGPFDRYCGFCGYEIMRGGRRLPLNPLWLLVVLIPLAAALAYGVSVARGAVGAPLAGPGPSGGAGVVAGARDASALGVRYLPPPGWTAADRWGGGESVVVMSRSPADQDAGATPGGDLLQAHAKDSLLAISRPRPGASQVVGDADPAALLTAQVSALLAQPPAGVQVEVARPVHSLKVGGRPAASVTLKLTESGATSYLERTLVSSARSGQPGTVRVDGLSPATDWGVDQARIEAAVAAIRFD